jgi:hypothetical protein
MNRTTRRRFLARLGRGDEKASSRPSRPNAFHDADEVEAAAVEPATTDVAVNEPSIDASATFESLTTERLSDPAAFARGHLGARRLDPPLLRKP